MTNTLSQDIIDEICAEKQIAETFLSYGWIRELSKDGKVRHIVRNTFDLNPSSAYDILNDKYATYEVLKNADVPVLEHTLIFNPVTRKELFGENKSKIKDIFEKHNKKVVVKKNNSSQGQDVYYCDTYEDTKERVQRLFIQKEDSVSICPFKNIENEYRVVYLDGEILLVYKKEKPYVIGDGKSTVEELLKKLTKNQESLRKIDLAQGLDFKYVPTLNEKVTVCWKHNLSLGAVPQLVGEDDEHLEKIKEIALKAGEATNSKFVSIDISLCENELFVMEINAAVCLSKFAMEIPEGRKITKEIYSKAIDKMFE